MKHGDIVYDTWLRLAGMVVYVQGDSVAMADDDKTWTTAKADVRELSALEMLAHQAEAKGKNSSGDSNGSSTEMRQV